MGLKRLSIKFRLVLVALCFVQLDVVGFEALDFLFRSGFSIH